MAAVSVGVRRIVIGLFAVVCLLVAIGHGIVGNSSSVAWLVAALAAGGSFLAIVRYGNSRAFYADSMADPKAIPVYVLLAGLFLLEHVLHESWTVAFWAILLGISFGFVVAPPSRPRDL